MLIYHLDSANKLIGAMLHMLLSFLLLLAVEARQGQDQFAVPRPPRRCFANEEFNECASPCEPTCKNPNPGVCSLQCVAGCQCKPGFLRNEHGVCVNDCNNGTSKPVCGPNEEFTECGTACEPTCREPRPKVCTLQCVVGCQCKSGFFRNDKNECVAECDNASSNICPENEEFRQCGTACEPTCENPMPLVCTAQCIVNVCQCKHGFFRNSEKKCVAQCGSDFCGVNEERKACGTACEPTCANPKPTCSKQCIPNVCQCLDTFIRDANNRCIPEEACPKEEPCGTNEERVKCGTACEPTCSNPKPTCSKQCINNVCQCRFGFIRNSKNQCIPTNACPPSERPCGTNEERVKCGTACEPTCSNPKPTCSKQCINNVCQCRFGFIRNSKNQCIPTNACPPSERPCGTNEERKKCGTACEPTCANPNPRCTKQCINNVCQCRNGFIRNSKNQCIPTSACPPSETTTMRPADCGDIQCPTGTTCEMVEESCSRPPCPAPSPKCVPILMGPPMMCGPHETWKSCSGCEPTCTNMNPACGFSCGAPRCECDQGFFRSKLGPCVTMEECRRNANHR